MNNMFCNFCMNHEPGDRLYEPSDWDGGIGFDYVNNIQFCPICGAKLQKGYGGAKFQKPGVIVKNIGMPDDCEDCVLGRPSPGCYIECMLTREETREEGQRPEYCPLVDLPSYEEFAKAIVNCQDDSPETSHIRADDLICDLLKKLGYVEG